MVNEKDYDIIWDRIKISNQISCDIEIDSAKYLIKLKTIVASTIAESGLAKELGLNKIIKPLLMNFKNKMSQSLYEKMASKALIRLIDDPEIQMSSKQKIVKWILNYVIVDNKNKESYINQSKGKQLVEPHEELDNISAFDGFKQFIYQYSKKYEYKNILKWNEGILQNAIKHEFETIIDKNKIMIAQTTYNTFYNFVIKLRCMFHIFRSLDSKMQIEGFSEILEPFWSLIIDIMSNSEEDNLYFSEEIDESPNCINQNKMFYIQTVGEILGEILAKNLVDRKFMLEFVFKLINVEQSDDVFKEIGRSAIDFALTCAENDQSVDFFKYLPCFIIPVLKNSSVQIRFSLLMAKLFKLLPLNKVGVFDKDISDDQFNPSEEYEKGFEFLRILCNKKSANKDEIIKNLDLNDIKIREYQQHGISWIVSLTDFGFNWALWDDMGLGKTFQALAAVAIKVKERKKLQDKNKRKTISIVVWPATLIHNWNNEIKKFFKEEDLKGIVYDESTKTYNNRELQKKIIPNWDIIIISYDKLRSHSEFFAKYKFLYIILDEAHLIKNAKSMTTLAIKTLKSERKLILTGTPLQNRVTELWSIFDFLMPGFLEDEQTFNRKYK